MAKKLRAGVDLGLAQLGEGDMEKVDSVEPRAPAFNGVS